MTFLAVLAFAIVFAVVFKKPILKYPWIFYILAIGLSALYVYFMSHTQQFGEVPKQLIRATMQKGSLGMAFFMIVMYLGVFDRASKVRTYLGPIRGELSIIAWLLVMGHVVFYSGTQIQLVSRNFGVYLDRQPFMVWGAVFVGAILLVLLLVLGVTSVAAIRKAMNSKFWVKLQKWSYLFYALVYVHLVLVLAPSALANGETARVQIIIYTVIFGVYLVLRIRRAKLDRDKAAKLSAKQAS